MKVLAEIEQVEQEERLRSAREEQRRVMVNRIMKDLQGWPRAEQLLFVTALLKRFEATGENVPEIKAEPGAQWTVVRERQRAVELDADSPTALVRHVLTQAQAALTPREIVDAVHKFNAEIGAPFIYSAINKRVKAGEFESFGPPDARAYALAVHVKEPESTP